MQVPNQIIAKEQNQLIYNLEHIPTMFKENIKNICEVLNISDRQPDKLCNKIKVIKDDCERNCQRINWTSKKMMEITKRRRLVKERRTKSQGEFHRDFKRNKK